MVQVTARSGAFMICDLVPFPCGTLNLLPMYIPGTQMHGLTAVLICLETIFFFFQLYHYLARPHDKQRGLYLILLFLLLHFNLSNGLFPDPSFPLHIKLQYMTAYGFAYLLGAYFPYYMYKVYRLPDLRFHATWGVVLFVLLPYALFDVVVYGVNGRLVPDREIGVLIPALYGLVVLGFMLKAIRKKYRATGDRRQYYCELLVWLALLPWEGMSLFAFFPPPQWLLIGLANIGWFPITVLQLGIGIRLSRQEHWHYQELTATISPEDFASGCRLLGLSEREIEVGLLKLQGLERQAIADKLFISFHTVKTHITNIYEKTGTASMAELIRLVREQLNQRRSS